MTQTLQQLVGSLSQALDKDQKLSLPSIGSKLSKACQNYPEDKTIGSLNRVISEMLSHNTLFIRKADFQSLCHKMYANGTKLGELFPEELNFSDQPKITTFQHDDTSNDVVYQVEDQVLASALATVFDNHIPLKSYSSIAASKASQSVKNILEAWNLQPNQISISAGNDKFIVIKADYETPKGLTSFYVPVEVVKNEVIEPEVFMGNTGPEDLNHATIKAYLTQSAGSTTKIAGSDILQAITASASENRQISATEMAITRLHAQRQGSNEYNQPNLLLGLKVEAQARPDIKTAKLEEAYSFEKEMSSPKGIVSWKFGADKVNLGRDYLSRELKSFGFSNAQIVITGSDDNSVFYGVSLNSGTTAFTVPVKFVGGKMHQPNVLLCNGSITSFSQDGIDSLITDNYSDIKVAAVASSMATLKPSEVINNLRQAITEHNFAKAEDALNVLANCEDAKAHETGLQIYLNGLNKTASVKSSCSKMIKSAVSEHPICSHTGLPITKVYQDKSGFCRPLFRQGMDETYEGASFMNAKVFG